MDKNTTYRLSYWENPTVISEPFLPEDNLTYSDAPMSDETTHKAFAHISHDRPNESTH